jgi:cytochrome c oxidase subunit 3
MASLGLFFVMFGAVQWVNDISWGKYSLMLGMVIFLVVLAQWFTDAISESEGGHYAANVDRSFRWSMSWFIFSEVMFFSAFFGALWWARVHSIPGLGSGDTMGVLWPDFKAAWPSVVPGATTSPAGTIEKFEIMSPLGLPTINTALLLASSVTVTIAHHAVRAGERGKAIAYMWSSVALGVIFLFCQGYEYYHAYSDLNLKLSSGIYGSTFFMLTGFHGFHVFLGTLMLLFITLRLQRGHFTADRHFGFEGASWYWHFVDVVWLCLYILVYWL